MTTTHPLGFRKIRLARWRGWALRLHIWTGTGTEDIHAHRWNLWAMPVFGRFVDERFTIEPGTSHRRHVCTGGTGGRRVSAAGTVAAPRPLDARVRRPMRPYRCPAGVLHRYTVVGTGWHVSVAVTGPPVVSGSDVWRPVGD